MPVLWLAQAGSLGLGAAGSGVAVGLSSLPGLREWQVGLRKGFEARQSCGQVFNLRVLGLKAGGTMRSQSFSCGPLKPALLVSPPHFTLRADDLMKSAHLAEMKFAHPELSNLAAPSCSPPPE